MSTMSRASTPGIDHPFGHVVGTTVAVTTVASAGTTRDLRFFRGDDGVMVQDIGKA